MKSSGLSLKFLYVLASASAGYLLTSMYFFFFPLDEPRPPAPYHRYAQPMSSETLLYTQGAGPDLPPEVRARMLGLPPPPDRPHSDVFDRQTAVQHNYGFVIGEHLQEQVDEMKSRIRTPEGGRQEDGLSEEELDRMASEGRMAW